METAKAAKELDKRIVFTTDRSSGVKNMMEDQFAWLPSYQEIFDQYPFREDCHPQLGDITYVLGPSGSGKTLFALGAVAMRDDSNEFGKPVIQGQSVTVYVDLSEVRRFALEKDDRKRLR
jgi:hypothetical protein